MSTITIHNKSYGIHEISGKIIESNKQRELHVYGSSHSDDARVNINSSTTIHDEFFLIDRNGHEHCIKLSDWDVSLRNGHEIQMIWVILPKKERGPYVVLNNYTLGRVTTDNIIIKRISKYHYAKQFWLNILAAIVLGFLFKSFILFLIIIIGSWIYCYKKSNQVLTELKKAIESKIN